MFRNEKKLTNLTQKMQHGSTCRTDLLLGFHNSNLLDLGKASVGILFT